MSPVLWCLFSTGWKGEKKNSCSLLVTELFSRPLGSYSCLYSWLNIQCTYLARFHLESSRLFRKFEKRTGSGWTDLLPYQLDWKWSWLPRYSEIESIHTKLLGQIDYCKDFTQNWNYNSKSMNFFLPSLHFDYPNFYLISRLWTN